jgi:O-antigen ligase
MAIDVARGDPAFWASTGVQTSQDRRGRIAIALFFAGVLLSTTLVFYVGDLRVSADRIVLLVFFVPALLTLSQTVDLRLQLFDSFVFAAIVWLIIALMVNNGPERGLKYGGSLAVEAIGGYLFARAYVRNFATYAYTVRTYLLFVIIAGAIALPETFLGIKLLPGLGPPVGTLEMGRLGFYRAPSGFDHPILFGAFCATSLGLVWYLYRDRPVRWILAAMIATATFLALSSAPLLACVVTGAFVLWEQYTRRTPNRTSILLSSLGAVYLVLAAFSNRSPIEVLLPYISLDAWSAVYRTYIWRYAMMNIEDNPIFGVGLNEWVRPPWMPISVDCLWLTLMLLGGIPTLALLATGMLLLMRRVHWRDVGVETWERWQVRFGWTAAVLALSFQAFTVHYWNAMNVVFFFVLGLGAWLTDARVRDPARPVAEPGRQGNHPVMRPVLIRSSPRRLVTRRSPGGLVTRANR